ncbi:glycosyltransferase family A protein [Erythrobacter sp.]|uniref:glycosyltransferase family 2 protein n=1 Tax=Erythrobacter sp. TaxID=1042 RepID=UPI001B2EBE28|nr:glycosyltransferase family A protein [Erythrobacter sp.]MBO6526349.1 glycosyltransferase family 2 protein [Erythrobacter sp.]MBO6530602.1 glycosyltransferase family 2 protein [Erythrobacter sp.]
MGMPPRISVIIPVYGPTLFLSRTIESVFQQTLEPCELILVDDNDPGTEFRRQTENIVKNYRAKGRDLVYIQHASNRNGAVARNTGVAAASGDYISFLDSDDFYMPDRLEILSEMLENSQKGIAGVYSGVEFRRRGKTYNKFSNARSGNFLVETLACKFMLGTGSNLFIRRDVIEELNGFDEAFWRTQDYEFLVRLFEKYALAGVPEILVVKNNENFNLPNFAKSLENREQYLAKYRSLIDEKDAPAQAYIIKSNYAFMGELALKEGLRQESRAMYKIASAKSALEPRDWMRRAALWTASWLR